MADIVEIGSKETLPASKPYRSGRLKYPWHTVQPGQWFQFQPTVKPPSARVMATNMGNALVMRFHVFIGLDGNIYCRRIDGLDPDERFLRYPRDSMGQVIIPTAELHERHERIEAKGRGRVYGDGIQPEEMPGGDATFIPGDERPPIPPDELLPGAGLPRIEEEDDGEI